jgi:hypothetical protein
MLKTFNARRSSRPRPTSISAALSPPAITPPLPPTPGSPRSNRPALAPDTTTTAAPRSIAACSPASTGSGTSVPSSHGTYPVLNDPPGPSRRSADHRPLALGFFTSASVSFADGFTPVARTLTARITFETFDSAPRVAARSGLPAPGSFELSITPVRGSGCGTVLRFIEHLVARRRVNGGELATMGSTRECPAASRPIGVSHLSAAA